MTFSVKKYVVMRGLLLLLEKAIKLFINFLFLILGSTLSFYQCFLALL